MLIIGVDCSTNIKNCGIATLDTRKKKLMLINKSKYKNTLELLYREIADFKRENDKDNKVLICLDVPLGWPEKFGETLHSHSAGLMISVGKNDFFTRFTDDFCSSKLKLHKNTILDVAADKIAKTSYTILEIIYNLKDKLNTNEISMVWDCNEEYDIGIIEVYPRTWITQTILGTLRYKSSHSGLTNDKKRNRQRIIRFINRLYPISNINTQGTNEHNVDAIICCLIGYYFNNNLCCPPTIQCKKVRKEGWIWFPLFSVNLNKLNHKELRLLCIKK